jgi:hypothetical protein
LLPSRAYLIDEKRDPVRKLAFLLVLLGLYTWSEPGLGQSAEWEAANKADRAALIAETPRVRIETPALRGSISLTGRRIDDLMLTEYRETIESDSPAFCYCPIFSNKYCLTASA